MVASQLDPEARERSENFANISTLHQVKLWFWWWLKHSVETLASWYQNSLFRLCTDSNPPCVCTLTHTFTHILLSCIAPFLRPGDSLETAEIEAIVDGVIQESDVARNHELSYAEFEHVISRAPDFVNLFHITIWTKTLEIEVSPYEERMLHAFTKPPAGWQLSREPLLSILLEAVMLCKS